MANDLKEIIGAFWDLLAWISALISAGMLLYGFFAHRCTPDWLIIVILFTLVTFIIRFKAIRFGRNTP